MNDASQTSGRHEGDETPQSPGSGRPPREERRARLRRQRIYALAAAAGVLIIVVVLLFTVGPFGSHLDRPGKPPLGYLREPLGGRQYKVTAWTLGDAAALKAAAATDAVASAPPASVKDSAAAGVARAAMFSTTPRMGRLT